MAALKLMVTMYDAVFWINTSGQNHNKGEDMARISRKFELLVLDYSNYIDMKFENSKK